MQPRAYIIKKPLIVANHLGRALTIVSLKFSMLSSLRVVLSIMIVGYSTIIIPTLIIIITSLGGSQIWKSEQRWTMTLNPSPITEMNISNSNSTRLK